MLYITLIIQGMRGGLRPCYIHCKVSNKWLFIQAAAHNYFVANLRQMRIIRICISWLWVV